MLLLEAMACLSCGRQLAGLDCARVVLASDLQAAQPEPRRFDDVCALSDAFDPVAALWKRKVEGP